MKETPTTRIPTKKNVTAVSRYCRHIITFIFCLVALVGTAWSQSRPTSIAGTVTDNTTGEPLPFVQISVANSKTGTVSDINGRFDLTVGAADTVVQFRMMGYRPQTVTVTSRKSQRIKVRMEPVTKQLATVQVTAKRGKRDRYRRKDNPAVELVKQVIAHKELNDVRATGSFSRQTFDKLNMCLDQFHPDFQKHTFWRHFPFVEKYIDQAEFDGAEVLHFSIHERMGQQEYSQGRLRTLTTATRDDGVDVNLNAEGLNDDLAVLFAPVDIYDNDIPLMSVHFVSPLSSTLANTFYHYYITDTVEMDGRRCIELSFVPSAKGNFGFVGSMYVVMDSTYALAGYNMRIPESVDLNYVRDLTVIQHYELDSASHYLPTRSDTYGRFYVGKKMRQVYVHQLHLNHHYAFGDSIQSLPDTLFGPLTLNVTLPTAHKVYRKQWNALRPMQLSLAETFLDSMRYELSRIPAVKATIRTFEALFTGYIPTNSHRDSSRFDFGSLYNFVSHNGQEGLRLRVGGMSTARLSQRNFFDGYIAYGVDDKQVKFNLNLIRTFAPKRRFPMEYPLGLVSLHLGYDIESPGLSFDTYARDNFMMWTDQMAPAQYVADAQLRLRKQWPSHISIDTWVGAQQIRPNEMLNYYRILADGSNERVTSLLHAQWAMGVRFSPSAIASSSRSGEGSLLNLASTSTSMSLNHEMGLLDGFYYNRTKASLLARVWLAAFGYLDFRGQGGMLWSQVPMPKLFTPYGNNSVFLSENAFNTMQPMEFVMDRYVSLISTYHMKGLILNHLPLVKRLRLREVLGFNILYGGLSEKNMPGANNPGLYALPTDVHYLGNEPYMEYSIGIENILKMIRIDYVRRLTYLEGVERPWAIKVSLKFTM